MRYAIAAAPITGQTPLFNNMMAPGFEQNIDDKNIECYCLDAPAYVPTGVTRLVSRSYPMTQAGFANRG